MKKKVLKFLKVAIALFCFTISKGYSQFANSPWGDPNKIKVAVVIQSGDTVSAWPAPGRNDMTGDATSWFIPGKTIMEPVGDGTYQLRVDLIPGAVYNYIFCARLEENIAGFPAGYEAVEPIPDGSQQDDQGNYSVRDPGTFISLSSTSYISAGMGEVRYVSINYQGSGDSRRLLLMPEVEPGTTVYVFNNFASLPRGVANYSIRIINQNTVELRWQGGLGTWGAGFPAVDCLGGAYHLYVSTSNASGPYSLLATLPGTTTSYAHSGLTPGTSYFYIFVASDAYKGPTYTIYSSTTQALWANLARATPPNTTWNSDQYVHNDKYSKPQRPVPVYFKVENIDLDYVLQHDNIVYLTPWDEDGRFYLNKIPGVLIPVYLPNEL